MTDILLEEQIALMKKYKIDGNQWLICQLVWASQQTDGAKYLYEYFSEVTNNGSHMIPAEDIIRLVDQEVLEPFDSSGPFWYDQLEFNPKFKKKYFVDAMVAGRQLWDAFPSERSYRINGRALLTKKIGNELQSVDDFYQFYGTRIKWSLAKHKEVLASLERAKAQEQIDFTIMDWVKNEMWSNFPELTETVRMV